MLRIDGSKKGDHASTFCLIWPYAKIEKAEKHLLKPVTWYQAVLANLKFTTFMLSVYKDL